MASLHPHYNIPFARLVYSLLNSLLNSIIKDAVRLKD